MPTLILLWHDLCPQVALPLATGIFQRLSEPKDTTDRRGELDLHHGSTGAEYVHGDKNSLPPGA